MVTWRCAIGSVWWGLTPVIVTTTSGRKRRTTGATISSIAFRYGPSPANGGSGTFTEVPSAPSTPRSARPPVPG